ncbi:hypothetical protein MGG_04141 [Pyricularia oryzae 70-15]|uniref:Zn(2)-C6 fungal-type domain-containing protein n=3 Tax=Pyricularia oryzae TaxID=318829 RepID=G4NIQ8_PYRO7|nr:uncharacterized protein MGG_04141 [Pyricularia oryzae 70-15]EHA47322.1 hypothetical protein MGG_04141 [Pyricularia oryzae 70-15]KAI7932609.1 hypothetical protein M0657_000358 [Pyricularia oryzae]
MNFTQDIHSASTAYDTSPGGTDSSDRPRTGVLRRSCEACRALKARCIHVPNSGSRCCKRCMDHGIDCVFEEAIARPKRARTSARTRVKDVEEKIDSLIALIAARKEPQTQVMDKTAPNLKMSNFLDSEGNFSFPSIVNDSGLMFTPSGFPTTSPMADMALTSNVNDVFSKGIVTFEAAQGYLQAFIADAALFPFVVISPHMTLDFLRRERPCLLLAIMVVCSQGSVQEKLIVEFKNYIAQHVIIEARRGVDAVQGLIVYCNWHNRCSNLSIQQLYQLTQLAVTLAGDFGLPSLATIREMNSSNAKMSRSIRDLNSQYLDELERIRTYLGCYHVSHGMSIGVRKPTHLLHSRRIEEAAKMIASLEQTASDTLIPHLIRLQRFAEDVQRTFDYNDPDGLDEMDGLKLRATVTMLDRQLSQVLEAMPLEVRQNTHIQLEAKFLRIYISEIGLQIPIGHMKLDGRCCDWCSSAHRTELIITCMRATQKYLDYYFALPDAAFSQLNVLQVGRHMYATTMLARVMMRDQIGKLDMALLGELAAAPAYVQASERKLARLITTMPCGKQKQDMIWLFYRIFKLASDWFEGAAETGQSNVMDFDTCIAGFDINQIILSPVRKGECDSLVPTPATMECLHELSTTPEAVSEQPGPETAEVPLFSNQEMLWTTDLSDFSPPDNNNWFSI